MNRYSKSQILFNNLDYYSKQFEARNVKFISHYRPDTYVQMTEEFLASLTYIEEVWSYDTKLYKLASMYYGDTTLWWIIGIVNNKPTDIHWKPGDIVKIPAEPNLILREIEV